MQGGWGSLVLVGVRIKGLQGYLWKSEYQRTLKGRVYPGPDIPRSPNGPGRASYNAQNKRGEKGCLSARRVCRKLGTS